MRDFKKLKIWQKVMAKIMVEQKMLMAFIDTLGGESARG